MFLAFSLSLSWFSGDQEKGMLEETLQETVAKQQAINEEYRLLTVKMRDKEAKRKELEAKLKKELKKQQDLRRSLAMEKRRLRQAVENGQAIDLDTEREKIRQEVEDRANKEIAKLEQKIAAIEAEKKRIEAEARKKLMARKEQDAEAWRQAEKAKARAREAMIKYKALKTTLKSLKEAKERAENILRIQAMARKKAEEALAKEKANRAALEARLKAVEEALRLTAAPGADKNVKNAADALVAEMEKARQMLRKQINDENKAISKLEKTPDITEELAKLEKDGKEKAALQANLEEKIQRIEELERELRLSKTREQALRANLEKKATTTAENAAKTVDNDKIDALRARIMSLEAKLRDVEEKKKAFAAEARAKIDELTKKTRQLETRNIDKNKEQKGGPLKANTINPEDKNYPQITPTQGPGVSPVPVEMQTKLENRDLLSLQGQVSNYVAQKMIDRNMELEAELQETRLQLAEARNAYKNARSKGLGQSPGLDEVNTDTKTIIARYRKAATTITALNQRNLELEAQATEKERAIAEAEAARFIIAKLQEQNLQLMKRLRELEAAQKAEKSVKTASSEPAAPKKSAEAAREDSKKSSPTDTAEAAKTTEPVPAHKSSKTAKDTKDEAHKAIDEARAEKPLKKRAGTAATDNKAEAKGAEEKAHQEHSARLGTLEPVTLDLADLIRPKRYKLTNTPPLLLASLEAVPGMVARHEENEPTVNRELRAERAMAIRQVVNRMEDLNRALHEARNHPGPERLTFVQVHEEIRKLRKAILHNVENKVFSWEDIASYLENKGGDFAFYLLKKNESPEDVAARKDILGNASLWPLLYRYNQQGIAKPDIFETPHLLIIYRNIPEAEKQEALNKAHSLGQWKDWPKEARRAWLEDWII